MKKRTHRLLSWLLCLVMVLGLLPTAAFARDDTKVTFIVVEMTEPEVGLSIEEVRDSVTCQTPGARIAVKSFTKRKDGEVISHYDANFIPGFTYRLYIMIVPNEGYTFQGTTDTTVQINFSKLPVTVDRSVLEVGKDYVEAYVEWTFPGTAENHRVRAENCFVDKEYTGVPYKQSFLTAPAGATVFVRADTPPLGQSFDKFVVEPADVELKYYYTIHNSAEYGIVYDKTYVKFVVPDEDVSIKALYKDDDSLVYDMSFEIGTPRPGQLNTDFDKTITLGGSNYFIADYVWFSSMGSRLYHSGDPDPVPFTFKEGETYRCSFSILPKWNCKFVEPYTITINGKTDGFTERCWWVWDYQQETIWCDIYLTCSNDISGTATLSGAYYDTPINPTLTGEVQELRNTDYSKLHFQWQCSSASGWTNISGATNLAYRPTEENFGKALRVVITADGYTGSVVSNAVEVQQREVCFAKPVAPSLRLDSSDYSKVTISNAVKGQEYLLTYSSSTPTNWDSAVKAVKDGTLTLNASTGTTVYVHTRVAETAYCVASIYSDFSSIYTGAPVNLVDFSLNYSKLDMRVGQVVALTATPVPANTTDWDGVYWYANSSSATLFKDKLCTQPYKRDTDGRAVTVYLKGTSQSNWFTVGAERTMAGSGGIPTVRQMSVRMADAAGNYLLEWLTLPKATLAPGESTTVDITPYPSPTNVGTLSFEGNASNPGGMLVLTPSADKKQITITAPKAATPGVYRFTVKVDGASTNTPSVLTVNVTSDAREIPMDSLAVLPGSITLSPGGSATLTPIIAPSNTTVDKTVTWTRRSGSSKITVDADGVVTVADDAADGDSAVIQAAVGSFTATCNVQVTTSKYTLSVTSGEAYDDDYNPITGPVEAGTLVHLVPTITGAQEFLQWVVSSGAVTIIDPSNPFVSFYMPAGDVSIKATYKDNDEMENPFTDVPDGEYYYDAVLWAVKNGITTGTSDTTFGPGTPCSRAQAVTFLWRAAGKPAPKSSTMPFTDVKAGEYYYDAVLWAVEQGITNGTSDTTFSPNTTCNRGQIVTFLWRAQGSPKVNTVNPFTDVPSGEYYYNAVLWAVKNGITTGTSDTTFSPNEDCTRGQIVTFLYRCMK